MKPEKCGRTHLSSADNFWMDEGDVLETDVTLI